MMMFSQLAIALAAIASVNAQTASWHINELYTLVNERLDPIVDPNAVSGHMHQILGGSAFGAAYNYADSQKASCTTAAITVDKSNYWVPKLYWINNNGSSFTPLGAHTRFYYHLGRNSPSEPVSPFPEGLRMLTGNPNNKQPTIAAWACHVQQNLANDLTGTNFNFPRDCPYGLRVDIQFPCCWDGVNLYKSDQSHMTWPQQSQNSGTCPWSHPIRLPQIMLEYTYSPSNWAPGETLAGNLAWANGDTTGYGVHADFTNGWDTEILARALNDSSCTGGSTAIAIQECEVLAPYYDPNAAANCQPDLGQMNEPGESNTDLVPVPTLPGCNPLWGNTPTKPTNCGTVAQPNVIPFQGTNGPLIASPPAVQPLPTTPGWSYLGCVQNSPAVFDTTTTLYKDSQLTATECQNNCVSNNLPYAFIGTYNGNWECRCAPSVDPNAPWYPGQCNSTCPGDSSETCGGQNTHAIWYAPSGTKSAVEAGVTPSNGTEAGYVGCYNTGGSSTNMVSNPVMTFTASTMTNDYCIQTCAGYNATWAATSSGNVCQCGSGFSRGAGYWQNDASCSSTCSGDSSQYCGGQSQQYSIYNISSTGVKAQANPKYPPGRQGCYSNGWSNGLTGYQWGGTNSITVDSCQAGCAALNYSLAAVTSGNQCRCGNQWVGSSLYPDSMCNLPCSGNKSETCGAQFISELYSTAPYTASIQAAIATKPVGWAGCYKDPYSGTGYYNFSRYDSSNNPSRCQATCTGLGYSWMILEVGNYCRCTNTDPTKGNTLVPFNINCNVQCPGDQSQTCGGWGNFEAVQLTGLPSTSAAASTKATPTAAVVSGAASATSSVTASATPSAGAAWSPSGSGSTGCFADYNKMNGAQFTSTYMTVDSCIYYCQAQGATYAGLNNGKTCMCSTVSPQIHLGQSSCTTPCNANANQTCGAYSAVQVWPVSASSNFVNPYSVAAADSNGYMGCWGDTSVRLLKGAFWSNSALTTDYCRDNCAAQGFLFAGAEGGNQCFCSNTLANGTAYYRRADSECNNQCYGNKAEMCGGGYRVSLYVGGQGPSAQPSSSDTASASVSAPVGSPSTPSGGASNAGYQGCFAYGQFGSKANYSFTNSGKMTPQFCQRFCMAYGQEIAAVQGGDSCYCGSAANVGSSFPSSYCSFPCSGDSSQMCGNDYLISVYAPSPAAVGFPKDYVGCFQDSGNPRILPNFQMSSSGLTNSQCRDICNVKGYSVYGTESGNQCFCGTAIPHTMMTDASCNSPCPGNSTQACGGSWKVSLFKSGFSSLSSPAIVWPGKSSSMSISSSSSVASSSVKVSTTSLKPTLSSSAATSTTVASSASKAMSSAVSSSAPSSASSSSSAQSSASSSSQTAMSSAIKSSSSPAVSSAVKSTSSSAAMSPAMSSTSKSTSAVTSSAPMSSTPMSSAVKSSSISSSVTSSAAMSTGAASSTSTAPQTSFTGKGLDVSATKASATTSSSSTSSSAPTPSASNYVGCFSDPASSFSNSMTSSQLSNANCQAWCQANGMAYAATTGGQTCACSQSAPSQSVSGSSCSTACGGSSTTQCGGSGAWSVYSVSADDNCSAGSKRAEFAAALGQKVRSVKRFNPAKKTRQDQI
ncbi:hypothetical protein BD324DRAFT_606840 [Kockovaella imperatae]|uniref:WSC domain-containing protein n=1 Tax=Kockovaella imperatae TaxID=4999 RepID=A0A1Y1UUB2_9TREE|nr:hypothetical protein BD324DRAFT_606840 [Kockovaella imperatae]ORX41227.1 hypothetical protein BD324DRAFT_606840 [Kockovaella imperatae]